MCEVAGISEKKTNHSLRATGASAMFNAEVPEKMIKSVTGHKSSKALAIYERPSLAQEQALSGVLMGGSSNFVNRGQSSRMPLAAMPRAAMPSVPNNSMLMSAMFSGLNNCNINISPQNFHVHIQPAPVPQPAVQVDNDFDEFDTLVQSLPPY